LAHWCGDCKAEVPIIARLRQEFASDGLVVIGPTQLYGYAAQGADATPEQERAYIEAVRARYYGSLQDMPVPLSKQNFNAYGASTTPTLVLLNRAGQCDVSSGSDAVRGAASGVGEGGRALNDCGCWAATIRRRPRTTRALQRRGLVAAPSLDFNIDVN